MEEEKKETPILDMGSLYDLNKNLVQKNEKELDEGILNSKKEIAKNFILKTKNKYFMLLCNERKDYTVFYMNKEKKAMDLSLCLIDECLQNRGEIRGIDLTKNQDAIEIWLSIDEEAFVYYFFPYDAAIVEI